MFEWINMSEKMRFILNVNKIEHRWIWHWHSLEYVHRSVFECGWFELRSAYMLVYGARERSMESVEWIIFKLHVFFRCFRTTCRNSFCYLFVVCVLSCRRRCRHCRRRRHCCCFLVSFIFWMQKYQLSIQTLECVSLSIHSLIHSLTHSLVQLIHSFI